MRIGCLGTPSAMVQSPPWEAHGQSRSLSCYLKRFRASSGDTPVVVSEGVSAQPQVKYDLDPWPEQAPGLLPDQRSVLESVFERVDALCGVTRRSESTPHRRASHGECASGLSTCGRLEQQTAPVLAVRTCSRRYFLGFRREYAFSRSSDIGVGKSCAYESCEGCDSTKGVHMHCMRRDVCGPWGDLA